MWVSSLLWYFRGLKTPAPLKPADVVDGYGLGVDFRGLKTPAPLKPVAVVLQRAGQVISGVLRPRPH